ncbi:Ig-like domain-containing protein [Leucobacter aridicollis]|uniref:Ig-like domain-containing protein n=1 Tax=Leucobacter aridicollis TaxID=283878 RepID=UPI002168A379|nr:Ig-like domain-containing protein [Leucobacter aridicollis]MCS3429365.1 hypothetical protein [Leucobacter aridicollis]
MTIEKSAAPKRARQPRWRREQRARGRRQRLAAVLTAALLGTSAAAFGPLAVASPALAAGTPHGEVVGIVEWPADADLHAGGVWGGGDMNQIAGTTGTPTTSIKRFNVNASGQASGTRNSYNLGVSAHATNPGIYATRALDLGGRSAASPAALTHYGFANTVWVDWSPATDNGSGEKGKTYSIEIPSPTVAEAAAAGKPIHRNFNNSSCGMEVNPYTSALVILNNCTANENDVQYLVLNPGPDGDPLTMEDNTFDWFVANPRTVNGGGVSDMTIDALGNVYNFLSPSIGGGAIVRTDAATGAVTTVGTWNQPPAETTGIYEWVSLGFLGGKMVVPTGNVNAGQKLFAVDPLTGRAEAIPGYAPGVLGTRSNLNYDGAGVEGAVGLQGKVVDVNGTGLANQTVAIYQDNGDGTATLQGSRPTDAKGEYAALLNWSAGVGYVRVVQPQLTTGAGATAEVKNGEVVAAAVSTPVNDNTNTIEVVNEGNNGVNPPLGTPLTTTISVADTDDLVKITGNNASVFYEADFTVAFAGSTADLSRNSLLSTNATAGNGPQHLNVAGDPAGDLRLGSTNGEYTVGATDNSHASDDGVFLNLAGDTPLAKDQLFATGQTYPMRAVSEGAQAANAKVGAWVSAAGAQNANPRGAFGDGVFGSGSTVDFDMPFPATAGFSTLRVNTSLSDVTKPDNTLGEYAATAATSDTKPWTTPGEVEDYDIKTVASVVRVSAQSSVTGTYSYSLTGVSATAPSATTADVNVTESGAVTPAAAVHEGSVGTEIVVTPSTVPTGAVLGSAKIINALTGDEIADATFTPTGEVTIPGSVVTMGSDIRVVLTYSEEPSAADSTLVLAPATALADGTSAITATVTVVGSASGAPLAGQKVKIVAEPANADVTVSAVTDNGDGTYTATITSSVAGTYPIAATVEISGADEAVSGSPADAVFTAGAPSATESTWEIDPAGPLPAGSGAGSTYTATATVKDGNGNAVGAGVDVSFTVPAGVNGLTEETEVVVKTDASGVATLALVSTAAGDYVISAGLGAEQIGASETRSWTAAAADAAHSTFSVTSGVKTADGAAQHVLTATAADEFDNPVAGEDVTFTLPAGADYAGVIAGTWVSGTSGSIVVATDASGTAAIGVTSTAAATYSVAGAITAGALPGSPADIAFGAGEVDASASSWTITPAGPIAAGETYTVTVTAKDSSGNPVEGAEVALTLPADVTIVGGGAATGTSGADGTVVFEITSTAKGSHDVSATIGGDPVGGAAAGTKSVEFTASTADASQSALTATTGVVTADGTASHTATATIKDGFGNPVGAGVEVTFTFPADVAGAGAASPQTVVTDADGKATIALTSEVAGVYEVNATIDVAGTATAITGSPVSVEFGSGGGSAENSEWEITPASGTVAVGGAYTAKVTVRDATDNLVEGEVVTFELPAGVNGTSASSATATTDENGVATLELTSEQAWVDFPIAALVAGAAVDPATIPIQFTAGAASLETSTITVSPTTIDVGAAPPETATVTVQLKDAFGNDVHDNSAVVVIETSAGTITATAASGTDTGTYTAELSGTTADLVDGQATTAELSFTVDGAEATETVSAQLVDDTAPLAPTVDSTDGGVVTGTAEPGSTVVIRDPDTGDVLCETTADATTGAFTCGTPDAPLPPGNHEVVAIDPGGNESPTTPITVTKPPVVDSTDGGVITGEGEPGDTIEVRDPDTGEVLCSTTVKPDGTFECGPIEGGGDLEVVQIDPDGNESAPIEITVTKPPKVDSTDGGVVTGEGEPGDTIEVRDPDTGEVLCSTTVKPDGTFECGPIEGGGDLEVVQIDPDGNESAPIEITVTKPPVVDSTDGGVITGEGEPGDTIEVRDPDTGEVLCSTTVKPDGTFECGPIEGGGDLEVVQIDPDGNESAPVEITVTKPPKVDSTDGGVVTGEGEPGDTIEVRDPDTGEVLCSTTVKPDGTFECGPIEDGSFEVVQIDPDGNESAPIQVIVDTTPPAPPVVNPTDGKTVGGTAEPGATVTVKDKDGNVVCEAVAAADGTWSCTLEPPVQPGTSLTVTATDAHGNVSEPTVIKVGSPWMELSAETLKRGETLIITGHWFAPGESVAGSIKSETVELGTQVANEQGEVVFEFKIPADFELGDHTAFLDGAESDLLQLPFEVVAVTPPKPEPGLPGTGGQLPLIGGAVALLLLAGGATALIVRRRAASAKEPA